MPLYQSSVQRNTANKISNLTNVSLSDTQQQNMTVAPRARQSLIHSGLKCFICDEMIMGAPTNLKDSESQHTREKVTKKLARLVGDDFCVIVAEDDVICRRCLTLFNTMDKYEFDLLNVRSRLKGFINKKYSIEDEEPPAKIQKLNESQTNRWQNTATTVHKEAAENQLKNMSSSPASSRRGGPVKLYKCIACDFKTTDLNAFQPHSSVCKGQTRPNQNITQNRSVNRVTSSGVQQKPTVTSSNTQQVGRTTIVRNNVSGATITPTPNRNTAMDFNQSTRLRPFKCRMCNERFATRDAAHIHARSHSSVNNNKGMQMRAENERIKIIQKPEVVIMSKQTEKVSRGNVSNTQKPLTDIIKEALSEEDQDGVNEFIEFHSCNLCSLTFVNKKLYAQHMKTHENPAAKAEHREPQISYVKSGKSQDTMGDLESIFEKMHSESGHHVSTTNGSLSDSKNVLITTQESGGITYNITIPQDDIEIQHEEVSF